MAARDTAPASPLEKLSVIVPVFNERNTLVEILRRMRAVELPAGIEREIIVVDDGSTDGTRDVMRQLGDSTVRVVMHEAQQGEGCRGPHRLALRDRLARSHPGRRSRVRPRGLAPAHHAGAAERRPGRLRVSLHRRAQEHAVPALDRQPLSLAHHQRALQHDALRHGDLLQARRRRVDPEARAARRSVRHRAGDHRQDPEARACGSTRFRSRTTVASSTRARRSPGGTASPRCGRS